MNPRTRVASSSNVSDATFRIRLREPASMIARPASDPMTKLTGVEAAFAASLGPSGTEGAKEF
jgi:hypothetical protein